MPSGGGINRRQRFLEIGVLMSPCTRYSGVNHLAPCSPFGFSIGQRAPPVAGLFFMAALKLKKRMGENTGTVADLAGHHSAAAEGDVAELHLQRWRKRQ